MFDDLEILPAEPGGDFRDAFQPGRGGLSKSDWDRAWAAHREKKNGKDK